MRTKYPPTPRQNPLFGMRGRFVKETETFEFKSDTKADALQKDETIEIETPSALDVMVYKSVSRGDWVSHVILKATDVELKRPGNFGSEWRWPEKPTREQILEHVMDMLKHEMQHQLGLEAHPPSEDERKARVATAICESIEAFTRVMHRYPNHDGGDKWWLAGNLAMRLGLETITEVEVEHGNDPCQWKVRALGVEVVR